MLPGVIVMDIRLPLPPWVHLTRIDMDYMTWQVTSGNGVRIGMKQTTMEDRLKETQQGLIREPSALFAAARGTMHLHL